MIANLTTKTNTPSTRARLNEMSDSSDPEGPPSLDSLEDNHEVPKPVQSVHAQYAPSAKSTTFSINTTKPIKQFGASNQVSKNVSMESLPNIQTK